MAYQGERLTAPETGQDLGDLPIAVQRLATREREIATLVFMRGVMTAKEVEGELSPLSNSAVRIMLNRLVEKGVLKRYGGRRGGGSSEALYSPTTAAGKLRQRAVKDLSEQYFDGSLLDVAATALRILRARS